MEAAAIPAAAVVLRTGDGAIEKSDSRRGLGIKPETRDVVRPDVVRPAVAHALEVRGRALRVACSLVNIVREVEGHAANPDVLLRSTVGQADPDGIVGRIERPGNGRVDRDCI